MKVELAVATPWMPRAGTECEIQLDCTGDRWWRVVFLGAGDPPSMFQVRRIDKAMPALGTITNMREAGCEMMIVIGALDEATPCGKRPTVGTNGLYRYCAHHMKMCADAGATTLVWDRTGLAILECARVYEVITAEELPEVLASIG